MTDINNTIGMRAGTAAASNQAAAQNPNSLSSDGEITIAQTGPSASQIAQTAADMKASADAVPGINRVLNASNLITTSDPRVTAEVQSLIDRGVLKPGMSSDEIAAAIHADFTSRYTYTTDDGADLWQDAGTTISNRSGDCEDLAIAEASILTAALQSVAGLTPEEAASRVSVVAGRDAAGTGHMFVSYEDASGVSRYFESTDGNVAEQSITDFMSVVDLNFDTYFTFSDLSTSVVKLDGTTTLQTSKASTVTITDAARIPPDNPMRDAQAVAPRPEDYPADITGMMDYIEDAALHEMQNFNPTDFFTYQPNSVYDLNDTTIAQRNALSGLRGLGQMIYGSSWLSMTSNQLATDDDWVILDYGKMAAWQNKLSGLMNLLRLLEETRQSKNAMTDIGWQLLFGYQKYDDSEQKSQTQDRASLINDGVTQLSGQLTTFAQKHNAAVYELVMERVKLEAEKEKDACKPGAEDLFIQEKTAELSKDYTKVMDLQLTKMKEAGSQYSFVEGMAEIIQTMEVELTTNSGQPANPYKEDYDGHDYVDYDSSKFVTMKSAIDLIFSVDRGIMEVIRATQKQRNTVEEILWGVRSNEDYIDGGISQIDEKAAIGGDAFSAYLNDKVTQIQQWNNMVQSNINAQKIREQMKKAQQMLIGAICLAIVCAIATVVSFGAAAPLVVGVAVAIAVASAVATTVLQVETMKQIKDIEDNIYQKYTADVGFGAKIRALYYDNGDALDKLESELLGSIDENFLVAASKDGQHFWEVDDTKLQALQKQLTTLGNVRRTFVAIQEMIQGLKDSVESALTGVGGYVQSGSVAAQADAQFQRVSIGLQALNYDLNDVAMSRTIDDQILKRKNEIDNQISNIIRDGAISIAVTIGASLIGLGVLKLMGTVLKMVKLVAQLGALASFSWSLGTMIGQIRAERDNLSNASTGFLKQKLTGQGAIARIHSQNVGNTGELLEMDAENALADAMSEKGLVDGGDGYQYVNTEFFKAARLRIDHVAKMRIAMQMVMAGQQELTNIADATLLGFSKNRAGTRLASQVIQSKNQSDVMRLDQIKTFKTKEASVVNRTVDAERQLKANTVKLAVTIAVGIVGLGLSGAGSLMSAANAASKAATGLMIAGNASLMFALAINNMAEGIINTQGANAGDGDLRTITKTMRNNTVSQSQEAQANKTGNQENVLDSHINEGADIVDAALDEGIISNTAKGYWGVDHGQLAALNTRLERMARVEKLLTKIAERQENMVSMAWRQTTGGGLNTEGMHSVDSVIDINKQSLQSRLQLNFDRLQSIVDRHNKKIELQNAAITNFILMGIAIALGAVSVGSQSKGAAAQLGKGSAATAGAWSSANMILATMMNMIRGFMAYFVAEGAENRIGNKKAKEESANAKAKEGIGRLDTEGSGVEGGDFSGFDSIEHANVNADVKAGKAKIKGEGHDRTIAVNQEYLQALRDMFQAMAQSGAEAATTYVGAKLTMATGKLAITRRQGVTEDVNNQILRQKDAGVPFLIKALRREDNDLEGMPDRTQIIEMLSSEDPQTKMAGLALLSERSAEYAKSQSDLMRTAPDRLKTMTDKAERKELKRQVSRAENAAYNAELLSRFSNLSLGKQMTAVLLNPKSTDADLQAISRLMSEHPHSAGQALATRMAHLDQGWFNNVFDIVPAAARAVTGNNVSSTMSQKERLQVLQRVDQMAELTSDQKNIIVGQVISQMPMDVWNMIKGMKDAAPERNTLQLGQQMAAFAQQFVLTNMDRSSYADQPALVGRVDAACRTLGAQLAAMRVETSQGQIQARVKDMLETTLPNLSGPEKTVLETGLTAQLATMVQTPPTNLAMRLTAQFIAAASPEQALELLHKVSHKDGRQSLVHERDLPALAAKASLVGDQSSSASRNGFLRVATFVGSIFTHKALVDLSVLGVRGVVRGVKAAAGIHSDRNLIGNALDPKRVMKTFVERQFGGDVNKIAEFVDKMKSAGGRDKFQDQLAFIDLLPPHMRVQVAERLSLTLAPPVESPAANTQGLLHNAQQHLLNAHAAMSVSASPGIPGSAEHPALQEARQLIQDLQQLELEPARATAPALTQLTTRIKALSDKAAAQFPALDPDSYQPVEELASAVLHLDKIETVDSKLKDQAIQAMRQISEGTQITAERVAARLMTQSENPAKTVEAFTVAVNQKVKTLLDNARHGIPVSAADQASVERAISTLAMMAQPTGRGGATNRQVSEAVTQGLRDISKALKLGGQENILINARTAMLSSNAGGQLSAARATGLAALIVAGAQSNIEMIAPAGAPPLTPAILRELPPTQMATIMAALSTVGAETDPALNPALQLIKDTMATLTGDQKSEVLIALVQQGSRGAIAKIANLCRDALFVVPASGNFPVLTDRQARRLIANPERARVKGAVFNPAVGASLTASREARKLIKKLELALASTAESRLPQISGAIIQLAANDKVRSSNELKGRIDTALTAAIESSMKTPGLADSRDSAFLAFMAAHAPTFRTLLGPQATSIQLLTQFMASSSLSHAVMMVDGVDRVESDSDRMAAIQEYVATVTAAGRQSRENAIQAATSRIEQARVQGIETHAIKILQALIRNANPALTNMELEKCQRVLAEPSAVAAAADLVTADVAAIDPANLDRDTLVATINGASVEVGAAALKQYFDGTGVSSAQIQGSVLATVRSDIAARYLTDHCSVSEARTLFMGLGAIRESTAVQMSQHFDSSLHLHAMLTPAAVEKLNPQATAGVPGTDLPATQLLAALIKADASPRLQLAVAPAVNIADLLSRDLSIPQKAAFLHTLVESGQMSPESVAANITALEDRGVSIAEVGDLVKEWLEAHPETAKQIIPHIHEKYLSSAYQDDNLLSALASSDAIPQADRRALVVLNATDPVADLDRYVHSMLDSDDVHLQIGVDIAQSALQLAAGDPTRVAQKLNALLDGGIAVNEMVALGIANHLAAQVQDTRNQEKVVKIMAGLSPNAMAALARPLAQLVDSPDSAPSNSQLMAWMSALSQLPTQTACHAVFQADLPARPAGVLTVSSTERAARAIVEELSLGRVDAKIVKAMIVSDTQIGDRLAAGLPPSELLQAVLSEIHPAQLPRLRQLLNQSTAESPNRTLLIYQALRSLAQNDTPVPELAKWMALLPHADQQVLVSELGIANPSLIGAYLQVHVNDSHQLQLQALSGQAGGTDALREGAALLLSSLGKPDISSAAKLGHQLARLGVSHLPLDAATDPSVEDAFLLGNGESVTGADPRLKVAAYISVLSISIPGAESITDDPAMGRPAIEMQMERLDMALRGIPGADPLWISGQCKTVITDLTQLLRHPNADPLQGAQAAAVRDMLTQPDSSMRRVVVDIIALGVEASDTTTVKSVQGLVGALPESGRAAFIADLEQSSVSFDASSPAFRELVSVSPDASVRPLPPGSTANLKENVDFFLTLVPDLPATAPEADKKKRRDLRDSVIETVVKDTALKGKLTQHIALTGPVVAGAPTHPNADALLRTQIPDLQAGNENHFLTPEAQYQIQVLTALKELAASATLPPNALSYVEQTIEELSKIKFSSLSPTAVADTPAKTKMRENDAESVQKMGNALSSLRARVTQETEIRKAVDGLMPNGNIGAQMRAVLLSSPIPDGGPESQTRFREQMATKLGDGLHEVSSAEAGAVFASLLLQPQAVPELVADTMIRLMALRSDKMPQIFELLEANPAARAAVLPVLATKIAEQINSGRIADPALFMIQGSKKDPHVSLATHPQIVYGSHIRNASANSAFGELKSAVFQAISVEKRAHMMAAYARVDRDFGDSLLASVPGLDLRRLSKNPADLRARLTPHLRAHDRTGAQAIIRELVRSGIVKASNLKATILAAFPVSAGQVPTREELMDLAQLVTALRDIEGLQYTSSKTRGQLQTTDIAGVLEERVKRSASPDRLIF